jgi:hypothetical protein
VLLIACFQWKYQALEIASFGPAFGSEIHARLHDPNGLEWRSARGRAPSSNRFAQILAINLTGTFAGGPRYRQHIWFNAIAPQPAETPLPRPRRMTRFALPASREPRQWRYAPSDEQEGRVASLVSSMRAGFAGAGFLYQRPHFYRRANLKFGLKNRI